MPPEPSSPRFELGDGTWALVAHSYPSPNWEYRVYEKNGDFIRRSPQFTSRAEAVRGMDQLRAETLQRDTRLDVLACEKKSGKAPFRHRAAAGGSGMFSILHRLRGRNGTVEDVRDGILSAAERLREAARVDDDESREDVAAWIEAMFIGLTDERTLRESAAKGLGLYRGGMGGFADYGTAVMADAGRNLHTALVRGRNYPSSR